MQTDMLGQMWNISNTNMIIISGEAKYEEYSGKSIM